MMVDLINLYPAIVEDRYKISEGFN